MGDVSGCVFGVVGDGFAVVASGTPVVALDAHRILAISGDDKNRAKLAKAMRKWKELSGVQYPDIASAAQVAHKVLGRCGYSFEAVVVGYDTPTDYAMIKCVVPSAPCPSYDLCGAVGPGALACKAVLEAGYRHVLSSGDAIELTDRCVAEIRRLGLPGSTNDFAVWYIDRDGAVPVKKEIMEAMARGRKIATDFLNSFRLASHQFSGTN
ncbi:unnamed protein product [Alopecurus aequalis]